MFSHESSVFIMKVNRKVLTALSALLIITSVLYGVYRILRGTDMTVPSLLKPSPGVRLVMSMEGFRFSQSENGRTLWRMRALNAELYENKQAQLKDLEITYFSPDRKEAALLGETGNMDTVTGDASILSGTREVRIVTSDGYLLTTNSLFWKAGERLVRSPDLFKLLGSEIYLEGKGVSANLDVRTIEVNSNVKAVLQE